MYKTQETEARDRERVLKTGTYLTWRFYIVKIVLKETHDHVPVVEIGSSPLPSSAIIYLSNTRRKTKREDKNVHCTVAMLAVERGGGGEYW